MKTIGAAEFKAHCLEILDHVGPEGIVITKRGKPVAKLVPVKDDIWRFYGIWKGSVRTGPGDDLLSTGVRWEAEDGKLDGVELPVLPGRVDPYQ